MALAAAIALIGAILALAGFRSLWKRGAQGGRHSAAGMSISLAVLAPFSAALYGAFTYPRLADISTDLENPLLIVGSNAIKLNAEAQSAAYPGVTGRRYEAGPERILALVNSLARKMGWTQTGQHGNIRTDGEMSLQFSVHSFVFGFTDHVAFRITDEGTSMFIDMRSKSGFGDFDLGANAARIETFMKALDELTKLAEGSQEAK